MSVMSEITLEAALEKVLSFAPVKIYYNNEVLWDDDVEIDDKYVTFEEALSLFKYVNSKSYNNIRIFNIEIQIVHFHHSIIYLYGKVVGEDCE